VRRSTVRWTVKLSKLKKKIEAPWEEFYLIRRQRQGEREMYVERETEKAFLIVHDAVSFWIQKRWYKNGKLTPAGWKAFHIAKREHCKNFGFNALKEFEVTRETEKAVLLRCMVESPGGKETTVEFWLPRSMVYDYVFVSRKVREIEERFPFIGTRVKWRGTAGKKQQG
jgi:hypothetical protein